MILLRALAVWMLIGGVWQIGAWLRMRSKFGRYNTDAAIRIYGRTWLLKMLASCFFWPVGVFYWFFVPKEFTGQKLAAEIHAHLEHMNGRCIDCGERHDTEPPQ
jgi:hypothetical protein